jgi:hypothetical protein
MVHVTAVSVDLRDEIYLELRDLDLGRLCSEQIA